MVYKFDKFKDFVNNKKFYFQLKPKQARYEFYIENELIIK